MIISEARNNVEMRWRDENGERQTETIESFKPYFYIRQGDEMPSSIPTKKRWMESIKPQYNFGDYHSLDNRKLIKVSFNTVQDLYEAREYWDYTYEGDISLARKYANDRLTEIPEYNMRKWYLDIETQVGGNYDGQINALTFYDSYDKEYFIMTHFPQDPLPNYVGIHIYEDEHDLLEAFVNFVEKKDPDMIIGWYLLGFDIPMIIKRLHANGINPRK